MKVICCRLAELMSERGLNQWDLHVKSSVSRDRIRALAEGDFQLIHRDTILALCDALECETGELFVVVEKDAWRSARLAKELTIHVGSSSFPVSPPTGAPDGEAVILDRQFCAARDLAAYQRIAEYFYRTGTGIRIRLVEHAMDRCGGGAPDLWHVVDRMFAAGNHVVIGSPLANPATELVLCRMFGIRPYTVSERGSFPYGFAFEPGRRVRSSFAWQSQGNEIGILSIATGKMVARRTIVPRGAFGEDCSLLALYRIFDPPERRTAPGNDSRTIVVIAGHGSLGSEAGAIVATGQDAATIFPARFEKPEVFVVAADYHRPPGSGGADDSVIQAARLIADGR
jgi:putative transcriptional regulator